jgi:phosphate starvation-inducible PhoH-like protein
VRTETQRRPVKAAKAVLKPLTENQRRYDVAILNNRVVFGTGPAGTGKTWWAAARAAEQLETRKIERIIVTRPAIEAGESLGFLPGELDEKYEPYFRPVRDALEERLGSGAVEYHLKAGTIEARPLGLLRGSTLKNCWVLLDEAQNTTPAQMKMFLTRIGENAKFIINGDPRQKDIPGQSGLADAVRRLRGLGNVAFIEFTAADIVRDPMCNAIALRYEQNHTTE